MNVAMTVVERLDARAEISNLVARYMRGIDDQDLALYSACLTDDVIVEHPAVGRGEGREAVLKMAGGVIAALVTSQHLVGNLAIEIDGPQTAQAWFEIQAMHVFKSEADSGALRPAGAWYHMRLRRVDGRWLVASAKVTPRWLEPGLTRILAGITIG